MKVLIIILSIISLCLPTYKSNVYANTRFARVEQSINLYKYLENNNLSNIICLIEKTYFVEIQYETDNYYKVNYNGVSGYVKKDEVKEVNQNPSTPYPSNIKITIANDCNLRSSPTNSPSSNNIVSVLRSGESDIKFIGRIFAEEAIDFGGTTWYYVNYKGNYGYIYNKYVRPISPIYPNTESISYKSDTESQIINPISHTPSLFIIVILFIPCLFILLILYLPRKLSRKPKAPKPTKSIDRY